MKKWRDIRGDDSDDPGRVARTDQERAALAAEYNRLRWRVVRAWAELRGKNRLW